MLIVDYDQIYDWKTMHALSPVAGSSRLSLGDFETRFPLNQLSWFFEIKMTLYTIPPTLMEGLFGRCVAWFGVVVEEGEVC